MTVHPASAWRVTAGDLLRWRRTWRGTVFTSFLTPVLFLLSLGIGLGSLVDRGGRDLGVPYVAYVGVGLLVASAMQNAATESSWPIRVGLKWRRTFHAVVSTPVTVADLVAGRLVTTTIRVGASALVFALVLRLFGVVALHRALLGVPLAVLTGLAFAAPVAGFSAWVREDWAMSYLFRFAVLPVFVLSGTFFPISQLPAFAQAAAWLSPLWHGVELSRAAVLGLPPAPPAWLSVAYLLLWAGAGYVWAERAMRARLLP